MAPEARAEEDCRAIRTIFLHPCLGDPHRLTRRAQVLDPALHAVAFIQMNKVSAERRRPTRLRA